MKRYHPTVVHRLFGALTLLALVAAIFASVPAVAASDCCTKACFCRHETAAARGASCMLRKGNPCGFRHPLPAAAANGPERPALPLRRASELDLPLERTGTLAPSSLGRPGAPSRDPATPPPRLSSSVFA